GYERSDWLQFVTPLDGEPAAAAEIETEVRGLEVPVPLRAYPTPPLLVSQSAEPSFSDEQVAEPAPLAEQLRKAKAWTYQAAFEVTEAAQDLVYLTVGFDFGPRAAALEDSGPDPFAVLAEFSANYPLMQPDLATLLLPPDQLQGEKLKAAKGAVVALADLAGNIAEHWGPVRPADLLAASAEPEPAQSFGFRLETRTRSGKEGTQLLDSLVLVSTADEPAWGPGGALPVLEYLDDDGVYVPLERAGNPVGGQREIVYSFERDVRAFERRTFAISYPELDPVVNQNARTSIWLTRNEHLVEGKTNERFVYRTPEVHFNEPISPSVLRGRLLSVGEGTIEGLDEAMTSLFADLLSAPPDAAATKEKLAVRYGYRVATPSGEPRPEDDLVIFTPIFFRPQFAYEEAVPGQIRDAVKSWLAANPPPSGQKGVISLDLTVFSGSEAGDERPLVELKRLDYSLLPG
nr:hypothetical protein [Actinomycetota bacterium]